MVDPGLRRMSLHPSEEELSFFGVSDEFIIVGLYSVEALSGRSDIGQPSLLVVEWFLQEIND